MRHCKPYIHPGRWCRKFSYNLLSFAANCGALGDLPNATFAPPPNTLEDASVEYTCDPKTVMIGGPMTRTCQSDAEWSMLTGSCQGEIWFKDALFANLNDWI